MPTHKEIKEVKLDTLQLWNKNPRGISVDRFEELKKRLKRDGFNDVLKVAADGKTVIGGNMRLRALKELGYETVRVILTEAETDQDIFRVALSDNEEFGYYDMEQLTELALTLDMPELELRNFEIHLDKPKSLIDAMGDLMPTGEEYLGDDPDEKTIECGACGAFLNAHGKVLDENRE